MNNHKKAELLRGMFAGATFNNSVVVGVAESGSTVSYQKGEEKNVKEEKYEGARQSLMDYVTKLMPVVATEYKEVYLKMWLEILEKDAVSKTVYERGRQQKTLFNRNLVANISNMMLKDGVIIKDTTDVRMAELLEPEKGKDHPVRGALATPPKDKQVKKAVNEVFEKHGVKVK